MSLLFILRLISKIYVSYDPFLCSGTTRHSLYSSQILPKGQSPRSRSGPILAQLSCIKINKSPTNIRNRTSLFVRGELKLQDTQSTITKEYISSRTADSCIKTIHLRFETRYQYKFNERDQEHMV